MISTIFLATSVTKKLDHNNVYNIGYLDGRNHVLALIVLWSKKKKPETVLHTLSNKETLEETLEAFDPGFFNNYDAYLGPID